MNSCIQKSDGLCTRTGHHMLLPIVLHMCYRQAIIALSDHPRQIFRKNSMEFFVGLDYYLYYFTSGCTLKSHGHKSFQNVLWSHDSGRMVCLLKFPHYLYLDPIMYLDIIDQMFKCMGNYFLFGALITIQQCLYARNSDNLTIWRLSFVLKKGQMTIYG